MSDYNQLGVLVVNYFAYQNVRDLLLSSVGHSGSADVTFSIVDNSCDDVEWRNLKAECESIDGLKVVLTRSSYNAGYAGGNNLAAMALGHLSPAALVVINPDVSIRSGVFSDLLAEVLLAPTVLFGASTKSGSRELSGIAAISCLSGRSIELEVWPKRLRIPHVAYPSGHFIALSSQMWRDLGGFDESYFLYSEEADMVLRSARLDGSIAVTRSIEIEHAGGLTTGSMHGGGTRSDITLYHATRSRVLLFRKHRSIRRYLPTVFGARLAWSCAVLFRQGSRAFRQVIRGLASGLLGPANG